jgi:hypothetical protein
MEQPNELERIDDVPVSREMYFLGILLLPLGVCGVIAKDRLDVGVAASALWPLIIAAALWILYMLVWTITRVFDERQIAFYKDRVKLPAKGFQLRGSIVLYKDILRVRRSGVALRRFEVELAGRSWSADRGLVDADALERAFRHVMPGIEIARLDGAR